MIGHCGHSKVILELPSNLKANVQHVEKLVGVFFPEMHVDLFHQIKVLSTTLVEFKDVLM
jgi:hypothetical protein